MAYAVKVKSKEVKLNDRTITTRAGTPFWITTGIDEWLGVRDTGIIPTDVVTFGTESAAATAGRTWGGAPFWVKNSGEFEVVEINPRLVEVQQGWELA